MAVRIICVGNRQIVGDDFGPHVYDCLAAQALPATVGIIDGGLGGLNLLRYLENQTHVLFIDTVEGFGAPGETLLLSAVEVAEQCGGGFDHAAGLPYLLRVMPMVLDSPPQTITIIGHEGVANEQAVHSAAARALQLALEICDDVQCA